jgi:hypothetical protein
VIAPVRIEDLKVLRRKPQGGNDQLSEKRIAREFVIPIFGSVPVANSMNKDKRHAKPPLAAGSWSDVSIRAVAPSGKTSRGWRPLPPIALPERPTGAIVIVEKSVWSGEIPGFVPVSVAQENAGKCDTDAGNYRPDAVTLWSLAGCRKAVGSMADLRRQTWP